MKKQKKQNLLTAIIIISVLALIVLVGSMVYEEIINMSKQSVNDILQDISEEQKDDEKEELDNEEPAIEEEDNEEVEDEEYLGEEEQSAEDNSIQSSEEKAIKLAKQEWGKDDTVIFSIVDKTGSKYRVSVTKEATVLKWYEVDTETWEISEY